MSASITHAARYCLLTVDLPSREAIAAGILLEDPAAGQVYIRMRRDWDVVAPAEAEVLAALEEDLSKQAEAQGSAGFFRQLEDTLSNALRIGERREVMVEDFRRALGRLYRQHVAAAVREFQTHLPRYSLAVAAGPFLENQTVTEDGWEEIAPGLRLTPEMFVARIAGRSMEPVIPDDSLCVFRRNVTGSRQGRLVLVEAQGESGSDRYTVKRYRSVKEQSGDGTWRQERITLEPLNPDFAAWDLQPEEDRYRIVAEFVQVLD